MARQEQENMLKELLKNSGAKGASASANINEIMNSLNTAGNRDFLQKTKNNPMAEKAAAGDAGAMAAFMKDLLSSPDGQNFVKQVQEQIK